MAYQFCVCMCIERFRDSQGRLYLFFFFLIGPYIFFNINIRKNIKLQVKKYQATFTLNLMVKEIFYNNLSRVDEVESYAQITRPFTCTLMFPWTLISYPMEINWCVDNNKLFFLSNQFFIRRTI